MVELVDTLALGASGVKPVKVQVLSSAPCNYNYKTTTSLFDVYVLKGFGILPEPTSLLIKLLITSIQL